MSQNPTLSRISRGRLPPYHSSVFIEEKELYPGNCAASSWLDAQNLDAVELHQDPKMVLTSTGSFKDNHSSLGDEHRVRSHKHLPFRVTMDAGV